MLQSEWLWEINKKNNTWNVQSVNLKTKAVMAILQNNMEHICDALRNLVQFVQFNRREKHPWSSVSFCKIATLQK